MTILVGYSDGQEGWIGSDGLTTRGDEVSGTNTTKFFKIKRGVYFGYAGSVCVGEIIEDNIKNLKFPLAITRESLRSFFQRVKTLLTEYGIEPRETEDKWDYLDNQFIIVEKNGVWKFTGLYPEIEGPSHYYGGGTGEKFANAYMDLCENTDVGFRLKMAIEYAIVKSSSCGGEISITKVY